MSIGVRRRLVIGLLTTTAAAVGWGGPPQGEKPGNETVEAAPALGALRLGYGSMEAGDYEGALAHYRVALDNAGTSELRYQALFGLGSASAAPSAQV